MKPLDLSVDIGPLHLKNPVLVASGTFGYGLESDPYLDPSLLGGVIVKGLSLKPRPGNPGPRVWETASGMLNAIGLQNIGVEAFLRDKLPALSERGVTVIANILGNTVEEYSELASVLSASGGVAALEVNVSCPNVKEGGIHFSSDPRLTARVTEAVKLAAGAVPVIVKLSPNSGDIVPYARACKGAGADAVSLINTLVGLAIDAETLKPRLANLTGGLSGPAIKPVAQRMVWEVRNAVDIPIIGVGGIMSGSDALEYLALGASAIQVGTANYVRPDAPVQVLRGIVDYCDRKEIGRVRDFVGSFRSG